MFITKIHQVSWFFISFFIILFVFFTIGVTDYLIFNIAVTVIMFTSLLGISIIPTKPFTLAKMVYVFNFFFFGVVPLNDLVQGNAYWGGDKISLESYLLTIWIIAIVNILFIFLNILLDNFFSSKNIKYHHNKSITENDLFSLFSKALILYIGVGFLIFYFADFNLYKVFFRGFVDELLDDSISNAKPFVMMVDYVLKPMPIVIFITLRWIIKHVELSFFYKILIFIFFVFSIGLVLPTSVPRFLAAALYIPLIFSFTNFWKIPYFMCCVILSSLLVVFPFLNNFRRFDSSSNLLSIDFDFLNHGHFDAFQNFARLIELDFTTNGYQILGSFFFFVPRFLWSSKPIGSGSTLADYAGLDFSNISMPFMAEGYINFGLPGVFIFIILLVTLLSFLDVKYWSESGSRDRGLVFYHLLFGLVFFLMRGDLLSGAAFVFGLYFSFRAIRFILIDVKRYKLL